MWGRDKNIEEKIKIPYSGLNQDSPTSTYTFCFSCSYKHLDVSLETPGIDGEAHFVLVERHLADFDRTFERIAYILEHFRICCILMVLQPLNAVFGLLAAPPRLDPSCLTQFVA